MFRKPAEREGRAPLSAELADKVSGDRVSRHRLLSEILLSRSVIFEQTYFVGLGERFAQKRQKKCRNRPSENALRRSTYSSSTARFNRQPLGQGSVEATLSVHLPDGIRAETQAFKQIS